MMNIWLINKNQKVFVYNDWWASFWVDTTTPYPNIECDYIDVLKWNTRDCDDISKNQVISDYVGQVQQEIDAMGGIH